jgi:hypothetical protein
VVKNEDGFDVLAKLEHAIDCVVRCHETEKLDFPGTPFIEAKLTEKYGFQVILGAFGEEGKWPIRVQTDYRIGREYDCLPNVGRAPTNIPPRIEIAIPAGESLRFLKELRKNLTQVIRAVEAWERTRGLK